MDENRKKLYDQLSAQWDMGTFDEFDSDLDNEDNQKVAWQAVGGQDGYGDFGLFQQAIQRSPQAAETRQAEPAVTQPDATNPGAAPMMEAQQTGTDVQPATDTAKAIDDRTATEIQHPTTPKDEPAEDEEIVNEPDAENTVSAPVAEETVETDVVEPVRYDFTGKDADGAIETINSLDDDNKRFNAYYDYSEQKMRSGQQKAATGLATAKPMQQSIAAPSWSGRYNTLVQEVSDGTGGMTSPLKRGMEQHYNRYNQNIDQARGMTDEQLRTRIDQQMTADYGREGDEMRAVDVVPLVQELMARQNGGHAQTVGERIADEYLSSHPELAEEYRKWQRSEAGYDSNTFEATPLTLIDMVKKEIDRRVKVADRLDAQRNIIPTDPVTERSNAVSRGVDITSAYNITDALRSAERVYGTNRFESYVVAFAAKHNMTVPQARERVRELVTMSVAQDIIGALEPGSNAEYVLRKALTDNMVMNLARAGMTLASGAKPGDVGLFDMGDKAMAQYEQKHTSGWDQFMQVLATTSSFVVEGLGGGGFVLPGIVGKVVGNAAMKTLSRAGGGLFWKRLVAGSLGGAANFGAFESQMEAVRQLKTGERNPDAVWHSLASGLAKGAGFGAVGESIGRLFWHSRGWMVPVGEVVKLAGETATFSAIGYLETGQLTPKDWAANFGMALGGKLTHPVQYIADVKKRMDGGFGPKVQSISDAYRDELTQKGYGTLAKVLHDGVLAQEDIGRVRDELSRMRSDNDVPMQTLQLAEFALNGRVLPCAPATGYRSTHQADGTWTLTPLDPSGRPLGESITVKGTDAKNAAEREMNRQIEKNAVTLSEYSSHGADVTRAVGKAVMSYCDTSGEDPMAVYSVYQEALRKSGNNESLGEVERQILDAVGRRLDDTTSIDNGIESYKRTSREAGYDIDKILDKPVAERTAGERKALDEYKTWLGDREEQAHSDNIADFAEWVQRSDEAAASNSARIAREYEQRAEELRGHVEELRGRMDMGNVVVLENIDQVENAGVRRQIEQAERKGERGVPGWYDESTDTTYVYLPHAESIEDLDRTIMHEQVTHHGLRVLKTQGYNDLCDRVWNSMSDAERGRWENYPGVKGIDDQTKRQRAAADEYIANLAERTDPESAGLWRRFVAWAKEGMRSLGIRTDRISDAELEQIIRESYRNLRQQRGERVESRQDNDVVLNPEGEAPREEIAEPTADEVVTPTETVESPAESGDTGTVDTGGDELPVRSAAVQTDGTAADTHDIRELYPNDYGEITGESLDMYLEAAEQSRKQAHDYANGEAERPDENVWRYWASRDGLTDPAERQAEPVATEPIAEETPVQEPAETPVETPAEEIAANDGRLPRGANADATTIDPKDLPESGHIANMADAWGEVTRVEVVGQNADGTTRVKVWFKNRPNQRGIDVNVDMGGTPQPPEPPTTPPSEPTGSTDDQRMSQTLDETLGSQPEVDKTAADYMPMENKGGGRMSPNWEKATAEQVVNYVLREDVTDSPRTLMEERVRVAQDRVEKIRKERPFKGDARTAQQERKLSTWQNRLDKAEQQLGKMRQAEDALREELIARQRARGEEEIRNRQTIAQLTDTVSGHVDEMDLDDYVAYQIGTGKSKLKWKDQEKGTGRTHGLGGHLGLSGSSAERKARRAFIDDKNGLWPEEYAELLYANMPEGLRARYSDRDVLNAVLDVMRGASSRVGIMQDLASRWGGGETLEQRIERERDEWDRQQEEDMREQQEVDEQMRRNDVAATEGAEAVVDADYADVLADAQARLADPNASEFEKQAARTVLRYRQRDGRGGASANGTTEGDGVRFRLRGDEERRPTFYSNAERAIENVKQGKATAEQWKAMLTKAGGIKAGEDKWMGLSDWLDENKGQSLTKDEVLQFVRDNGIRMEERTYQEGVVDPSVPEDVYNDFEDYYNRWTDDDFDTPLDHLEYAWDVYCNVSPRWIRESIEPHLYHDGTWDLRVSDRDILRKQVGINSDYSINRTRLNYTTRGLENKREIAFVVDDIEPYQESDEIHFGPENEGRAVMWVRFGETRDKDGNRVLVIDEVQSNRHQDARESGYVPKRFDDISNERLQLSREINKFYSKLYGEGLSEEEQNERKRLITRDNELAKEQEQLLPHGREDRIPDAPFEKNWMEVAMKRMLRLAAEEGFDKVAWTTGAQQAERYGIGGVVGSITKGKTRGENTLVSVQYKNGKHDSWVVAPDGKVVDGGITTGENLSDLIGKELSEKVMSLDENGSISGDGLRIGGEGMSGFYDQIVPSFMRKYVKKWGSQVGEVELATPGGEVMHSVDVTEPMRDSVMQGQPLFRIRGEHKTGDRVRVRREGMNDGRVRVDGLPGEWRNIDEAGRAMQLSDPEHMYVPSDDGKWLDVYDWRDNEVWNIWRGKPGSKRFEKWRERTLKHIHQQVPDYAKKLGLDVELIDDEAAVPAGHEREKSWRDPETGKIHIVVPRHAAFDVSDVMSSLWHEGVSRHGLRKLVGDDNYDTFLDNVYATSDANIRAEIDRLAEEVTDGDRRGATEEYLSRLAEQMGFQYYKDGSVPVRSWMQRGLKVMRENFDKLCRHLGLFDMTETLRDDDLRAVLYDSYHHMLAENRDAYAAAKRAEREDKEYVKAVKRGDIDTAMTMLHRKLAASEGIVGYAAAHGHGGSHREVSHRLKDSESGAIEQAARDMAQYVPKDAVLVPMPPHEGVVRKDTDTWLLAQELSRMTGAPVVAALRGRERESRYAAKLAGRKGLSADELGFYQDMELPDGKTPVFVDNVVGSGETAKAAVQAMGGRGMTLAYTKGNLGKPTEGLKNVTVTYDDAGNLIPLSERFDRSNSDVRFRFVGERGAANQDAADGGERMRNKEIAEAMERGGKDARAIKLATGWERGKDGKWRHEEGDNLLDLHYADDIQPGDSMPLYELLPLGEDNRLFEAYPELKGVTVEFRDLGDSTKGSYNEETRTISISNLLLPSRMGLVGSKVSALEELNKTLLHEQQHAIQAMEGFAKGGNPWMQQSEVGLHDSERYSQVTRELITVWERLNELDRMIEKLWNHYDRIPWRGGSEERKRVNAQLRPLERERIELIDRRNDLMRERKELADKPIGYDTYNALAGEVEARNVSERMKMTDEQRRQSLAAHTEDVARDEQIVRFGNGVSMSEGDGVFTFSDRYAKSGGRFYQDSKGNIDLVDIDQSVFDKMGVKKMPFRMTDGMAHHVYTRHGKELGLSSEADAVRYVVDIMTNFDHVRKGGEDNTYVFSIENGRDNTTHRSITIVLPESDGEYMGIKTSGRVRLSSIQKMPLLWEKSAEPSATDAVSANVATSLPNSDGRTSGNASNQSNGIGGKGSDNSSISKINEGKTTGNGVNFRVRDGHEAAVEDARRRLESDDASEFERQAARAVIKAYGGGDEPDTPDGGGPRFRIREPQKAIEDYERAVNSSGFQVTEAMQDSMMGLKKLMQAIVGKDAKGKEKAIQDIAGFENAYLKENRLQSESVAQVDEYRTKYYSPLVKAVSALIGKGGKSHRREALRELTDYMMAKHGLERNEVLAQRDAMEQFESDANKDAQGNYIKSFASFYDKMREKDYSGLTGLTGETKVTDAEDAARQMVDAYEAGHDTTELWQRTKEATDATLDKLHESGVLSDEAYTRMKTMFEHYIPLRGWDQTTSDEVYGYLTGPDGPLGGSIVKGAKGRRSQADDPLATIMMMASDGIREANRNVMKQRFLTFVLNNPSDAVSVNRLWLARNAVTGEWQPVFADLDPTDSPEVVRQKVEQFEQDMTQLAQQDPDNFKHGKQAANIPYKVVNGNIGEHRVLVKHNGQTYVLTINGNPRAAQALNGLTNPDTRANNFVGKTLGAFAKLNRVLSQMFTTYSPKFVVRNFARDMGYSIASSAFVKEGGEYGRKFVTNYATVGFMGKLFNKWEDGTLDRSKPLEDMFYQFMHNGGETGFSAPQGLNDYKKALDKELRKENSKTRQLLGSFGEFYLRANRAVENRARFAAFVTSMEMDRGVDRSIWDAKEVSVNFNKKGAGAKMFDNPDQTLAGKTAGLIGDGGRSLFVFWNAAVQGLTNYGKTFKESPVKATTHAALLAGVGYMMPQLMQAIFGDDDDYYDLPEYVRRNNICFRWSKDMPWVTIPLSMEHTVPYAIGDILAGLANGKKQYMNGEEIANDFAKEVSKALPLDITEGGGGHWWIPSAIKPVYEAYEMNESWTGAPIANQTEWNEQAPEYQRVYKTASKPFVAATELLNNATNTDESSKGLINWNPSKLEYVFKGYGGGLATLLNDCVRMFDVAFTDAEMEAHDIPIAGSLLKSGNPTTKRKEIMRQYYHYRDDAEGAKWELKNREGDALERFKQTDRYERYLVWKEMSKDVDKLKKQMKDNPDLETEYYTAVEKLVSAMREQHAGKREPSQDVIAEVEEGERMDSIAALPDKTVHDAIVPLSDSAPQDSVDVKREGIKRAYKSEGVSYSKPSDDSKNALAYEHHATYDDIAEDAALKGRKDALKKSVGDEFEKMGAKYEKGSDGWGWYIPDSAKDRADEIRAYKKAHEAELEEYGILSWWFGTGKGSSGYIKKGFSSKDKSADEVMKEYRDTRKQVLSRTKRR